MTKTTRAVLIFLKMNGERDQANEWIHTHEMDLYVRKTKRYIDGEQYQCLDLASVNVFKRGKGTFTKFLQELEVVNPLPLLYIENVHSLKFHKFFLRQGYNKHAGYDPTSFYKLKETNHASDSTDRPGSRSNA